MSSAPQRPGGLHPPGSADLDERSRRVLAAVVRDHIEVGEPVGSRAVARRSDLDVSSATVRAVMADLEALGYLEKPHTSAGRIPTARGYRYYVDALLRVKGPRPEEKQLIEKRTQDAAGPDGLLAETSRLLHAVTRHAGVVASPRPQSERLARIELIPLREGRILAVLVTHTGAVQNRLLTLDPGQRPLSDAQLEQAMGYLNALLSDLTLAEARAKLKGELDQDRALLEETRSRALQLGAQAVQVSHESLGQRPDLRIEGQSSLLDEPFLAQDLEKVRSLFKALDEKERVLEVLDRALSARELTIFIGAESGLSQPELSIVAAPYRWAGQLVGTIGVIGPTRMDYARVIPLVEFTARTVGLALSRDGD